MTKVKSLCPTYSSSLYPILLILCNFLASDQAGAYKSHVICLCILPFLTCGTSGPFVESRNQYYITYSKQRRRPSWNREMKVFYWSPHTHSFLALVWTLLSAGFSLVAITLATQCFLSYLQLCCFCLRGRGQPMTFRAYPQFCTLCQGLGQKQPPPLSLSSLELFVTWSNS